MAVSAAITVSISIHALREEGDLISLSIVMAAEIFLSTPSARRATKAKIMAASILEISIHALREEGDIDLLPNLTPEQKISIHALREEGDSSSSRVCRAATDFYPRPPRGGRPG